MTSNSLCDLFLILSYYFLIASSYAAASNPLIFPIKKDGSSHLYYTTIPVGNPATSVNTLLDLAVEWTWFNCDRGYNSSAYSPIPCGSDACRSAGGLGCVGCKAPARPGCTNDTCGVFAYNPFQNVLSSVGLGEDTLLVHETDGLKSISELNVGRFLVSCVSSSTAKGLPSPTTGYLAMSRSKTSLPSMLSAELSLSRKFAICLPSSSKLGHGDLYVGGGPYFRPFFVAIDFSKYLVATKLLVNPVSTAPIHTEGDASFEYFVDVTAIKVDDTPVSFNNSLLDIDINGVGGAKISTVTPYTKLHTSIYYSLLKTFAAAASEKKMKETETVAPFGLCYETKLVNTTKAGPNVPTIVLVLQGDVKWEIRGANSMVKVSEDVMCLGFVDSKAEQAASVIIGGHQLEENLIEFDIDSSTFAFSNSLLLLGTSCTRNV